MILVAIRSLAEAQRESKDKAVRGVREGGPASRLGNLLLEAKVGFASGVRDPAGVIQLRMNNVTTRGTLDWSTITRVPRPTTEDLKLVTGDVVFNNTNSVELVGKSALFAELAEPVYFSNHFTRLRASPSHLLPAYLAFWLQAKWQAGLFSAICNRWVGQAAVQREKLLALEIAVPSLPEQQRIVAALTGQLAQVARARAAAEARLEAVKALRRGFLRSIFTSAQSNHWPLRSIGDVCEIQLGKMLSPKSKTGAGAARYLRNANVQWDRFDLRDMATMDFDDRERGKFLLKDGDLLVCEGGEPGRSAVWNGEIDPCFYQKALHRVRSKTDAVDPRFLMFRLWHGSFEGEFEESHAKTTIAHLPAVRLSALRVRLPSIEEQRGCPRDAKETL